MPPEAQLLQRLTSADPLGFVEALQSIHGQQFTSPDLNDDAADIIFSILASKFQYGHAYYDAAWTFGLRVLCKWARKMSLSSRSLSAKRIQRSVAISLAKRITSFTSSAKAASFAFLGIVFQDPENAAELDVGVQHLALEILQSQESDFLEKESLQDLILGMHGFLRCTAVSSSFILWLTSLFLAIWHGLTFRINLSLNEFRATQTGGSDAGTEALELQEWKECQLLKNECTSALDRLLFIPSVGHAFLDCFRTRNGISYAQVLHESSNDFQQQQSLRHTGSFTSQPLPFFPQEPSSSYTANVGVTDTSGHTAGFLPNSEMHNNTDAVHLIGLPLHISMLLKHALQDESGPIFCASLCLTMGLLEAVSKSNDLQLLPLKKVLLNMTQDACSKPGVDIQNTNNFDLKSVDEAMHCLRRGCAGLVCARMYNELSTAEENQSTFLLSMLAAFCEHCNSFADISLLAICGAKEWSSGVHKAVGWQVQQQRGHLTNGINSTLVKLSGKINSNFSIGKGAKFSWSSKTTRRHPSHYENSYHSLLTLTKMIYQQCILISDAFTRILLTHSTNFLSKSTYIQRRLDAAFLTTLNILSAAMNLMKTMDYWQTEKIKELHHFVSTRSVKNDETGHPKKESFMFSPVINMTASFAKLQFCKVKSTNYDELIQELLTIVLQDAQTSADFLNQLPTLRCLAQFVAPMLLFRNVPKEDGDKNTNEDYYVGKRDESRRWHKDLVLLAEMMFYLPLIPSCIEKIPGVEKNDKIRDTLPQVILLICHPLEGVALASHTCFINMIMVIGKHKECLWSIEEFAPVYVKRVLSTFPAHVTSAQMSMAFYTLLHTLSTESVISLWMVEQLATQCEILFSRHNLTDKNVSSNFNARKLLSVRREAATKAYLDAKITEGDQNIEGLSGSNGSVPVLELYNVLCHTLFWIGYVHVRSATAVLEKFLQCTIAYGLSAVFLNNLHTIISKSNDNVRKPHLLKWWYGIYTYAQDHVI